MNLTTRFDMRNFLLPLFILSICFQSLIAQEVTPEDFYGFWEIQEPAGDTCIVIVKRGGRMSCFWSGTANSQIQQGSWSIEDGKLHAKWDSGYSEVFSKLGSNAISRETFAKGDSITATPSLTVRGVRVDNRIPGSLTTNPNNFEARDSEISNTPPPVEIPAQNPFTGFWKMNQSTGIFGIGGAKSATFYISLDRNGTATTALRNWDAPQSISGKWRIENGEALIEWANGLKDKITQSSPDNFTLASYGKNQTFNSSPRENRPAQKASASEANQYFTAGNVQTLTVADIRGTWSIQGDSDESRTIEIEGWGNAYRFPSQIKSEGSDPGKWRLQNDRVVITWVDGSKDVIRLAFPQFKNDSYAPGEPITGTPIESHDIVRLPN